MSYKYLGPDGYYLNNNNIDSFGVDHSGFSTRDELEYQYNRITNRDKMQPNGSFGTPPSALSSLTNQYKNSLNGGYTHPSQWGLFPQQSSFTGTQYAQLATPNTMSDVGTPPYVFSQEMRQLLGQKESSGAYDAINNRGLRGEAIGKYQLQRNGLIDAGYYDRDYRWTGKNGINSRDDFLNNPQEQERALDDYMQAQYRFLQNNGSYGYLGYPVHGTVSDFDITNTGLLAASHREGARNVRNFLNSLVRNANGRYYMDYDSVTDPVLREKYRHIETRLREFEK